MARILRTIRCWGFSRTGVIQYRRISNTNIQQLEEALSDRKEVLLTPCSTGFSRFGRSSELDVYAYAKDRHGNVVDPENFSKNENLATYSVSFDELYSDGIEELNYICKTGSSRQPVPVAALLRFLAQKGEHENSMLSLHKEFSTKAEKLTEADISAILAVHLVSQLVVESSTPCMVSNGSKRRTPWCPCGACQNEVTYGNTGFGSEELWYGKPDIMAFPLGAGSVSVIVKKHTRGAFREITEVEEDRERSVIEGKCDSYNLKEIASISQITMQAITFSFFQKVFQKNQNIPDSEVVSLIPTVALCAEGAYVYMYDSEYDICLKSECDALPFWNETTEFPKLDLNTVITLWMMFNHLTFKPHFPEKMINHLKGSCGFKKKISHEKLEKIEKSIRMQKNFTRKGKERFPQIDRFIPFR